MSLTPVCTSVVVCVATLLLAFPASGASILTPYNVIVSGNFVATNDDVQGGLAVGGIVETSGYSAAGGLAGNAGINEPADPVGNFPSSTTFIAAGGIAAGDSIAIGAGNYFLGSGSKGTLNNNGTGTADATDPITWTGTGNVFTAFENQSAALAADAQKGATLNVSGATTTINVTGTGQNIVYVPYADLKSGQTVTITNVTSANYLIIDVTGLTADTATEPSYSLSGSITIDGAGSNNVIAEDVLFNFYQPAYTSPATSNGFNLALGSTTIGSVLAPWAAVTTPTGGGTFSGSLVAASYDELGNTQFHNFLFMGGQTPEPAPVACVGLGLLALAYFLRNRRPA